MNNRPWPSWVHPPFLVNPQEKADYLRAIKASQSLRLPFQPGAKTGMPLPPGKPGGGMRFNPLQGLNTKQITDLRNAKGPPDPWKNWTPGGISKTDQFRAHMDWLRMSPFQQWQVLLMAQRIGPYGTRRR